MERTLLPLVLADLRRRWRWSMDRAARGLGAAMVCYW